MISRISLSVALVAAANAQYVKYKTISDMGTSANMGGSCEVEFMNADGVTSEGTAWVAVATINGVTDNTVLARGSGLCETAQATSTDYTMDYTISLSSSSTLTTPEATGLGLTCPTGATDAKTLRDALKAQIGNNSVANALGDLDTVLTGGSVVFLSNEINAQAGYDTASQAIIDALSTSSDTIVDDMETDLLAQVAAMTTATTVTAKSAFDTALAEICAAMKTDVTAVAATDVSNWSTIQADVETALDTIVSTCTTELEKLWTDMTTAVTAVDTAFQTTINTTAGDIKAVTATDKASAETIITGEALNAKIIEKQLYKQTVKNLNAATKGLKDMFTDSKTVSKDALTAVKDGFKTNSGSTYEAIDTAMDTVIDAAETTISALLASGSNKTVKELAKLHKIAKTSTKTQGKAAKTAGKTATKALTDGAKTSYNTEKTDAKTYKTGLRTDTQAVVGDSPATPFPTFTSASGSFDYKTMTDNLETITVTVTRAIDDATATCTLSPAYETATTETCDYTAFDELFFDYVCGMGTFTYKKTVIDCSLDTVRPSVSCYGINNQAALETAVTTAVDALTTVSCTAADASTGEIVCTDSATGYVETTQTDGSSVTVTSVSDTTQISSCTATDSDGLTTCTLDADSTTTTYNVNDVIV